MQSAITLSLVPEARGGPFVLWDDLEAGCAKAAALGFDAVELFPRSAEDLNAKALRGLLERHELKLAAVGTGAGWVAHRLRLTDPDAAVRGRARDFIGALIDLAGGFGAPVLAAVSAIGDAEAIPAQPTRGIDAAAGLAYNRLSGRLHLVYVDQAGTNTGAPISTLTKPSDRTTAVSNRSRVAAFNVSPRRRSRSRRTSSASSPSRRSPPRRAWTSGASSGARR